MSKLSLDDLEKYNDESSTVKFKKRASNPKKKHHKTKRRKDQDYELDKEDF